MTKFKDQQGFGMQLSGIVLACYAGDLRLNPQHRRERGRREGQKDRQTDQVLMRSQNSHFIAGGSIKRENYFEESLSVL